MLDTYLKKMGIEKKNYCNFRFVCLCAVFSLLYPFYLYLYLIFFTFFVPAQREKFSFAQPNTLGNFFLIWEYAKMKWFLSVCFLFFFLKNEVYWVPMQCFEDSDKNDQNIILFFLRQEFSLFFNINVFIMLIVLWLYFYFIFFFW